MFTTNCTLLILSDDYRSKIMWEKYTVQKKLNILVKMAKYLILTIDLQKVKVINTADFQQIKLRDFNAINLPCS